MFPSTVERVPLSTDPEVNDRIRQKTEKNVARCAAEGLDGINKRLTELNREWDIERVLEMNASSFILIGLLLGAAVHPAWYLFPAVVAGFLLMHAIQGWCPPVPILRRLRFRTASEIDYERYALKSLRGDFRDLPSAEQYDCTIAKQTVETMRQ